MIWSRIKSWFTPRNTAQEIIERVKARGAIYHMRYGIYVPYDPIVINGLKWEFTSMVSYPDYHLIQGPIASFNLIATLADPKPETPFVPQLPLL